MRGTADGQATVEVVLILPFLVVAGLLLAQVELVVRDQLGVIHAAREAVRAASVDPDPAAAQAAASAVIPGSVVRAGPRPAAGEQYAVEVDYRSPTHLPVVGPLLPDVPLSARALMRVEE